MGPPLVTRHVSNLLVVHFVGRLSLETKPRPRSWPTLSIVWRQLNKYLIVSCIFHVFNVTLAAQKDLARPPPEPWQELLTCGDTVQMMKCPSPDTMTYVLVQSAALAYFYHPYVLHTRLLTFPVSFHCRVVFVCICSIIFTFLPSWCIAVYHNFFRVFCLATDPKTFVWYFWENTANLSKPEKKCS